MRAGNIQLEDREQIVLIGRSKPFTKLILTNQRIIETTSRSILSEYKLENVVHVAKTRNYIYFSALFCILFFLFVVLSNRGIDNDIMIALAILMVIAFFIIVLVMPKGIRVTLRGGSARALPTYTPKKWIDTINEYRLRAR